MVAMRRGAPINSQYRKPAVMADIDDIEGGGAPNNSGNFSGGNSSFHASPMEVSSSAGTGGLAGGEGGYTYDSGKAKRRTCNRHEYQSLLVGAAGGMSNSMLQKTMGYWWLFWF